jgi:hypothetical protein
MSSQFNRIPLIYSDEAGQLQEIPIGDTIDAPDVGMNVGIHTAVIFSHKGQIDETLFLTVNTNNYFHVGPVTVGSGATIVVGAGVTYRIV